MLKVAMINVTPSFRTTLFRPPGVKNTVPPPSETLGSNPDDEDARRRHPKQDWQQLRAPTNDNVPKRGALLTTTSLTRPAFKNAADEVPLLIYNKRGGWERADLSADHDIDCRV